MLMHVHVLRLRLHVRLHHLRVHGWLHVLHLDACLHVHAWLHHWWLHRNVLCLHWRHLRHLRGPACDRGRQRRQRRRQRCVDRRVDWQRHVRGDEGVRVVGQQLPLAPQTQHLDQLVHVGRR